MQMKAEIQRSQLVIVDMQEKLAGAMPKEVINKIIRRIELIATLAKIEEIPVVVTEQYPTGLGKTISSMIPFLTHAQFIEKTTFSCVDDPKFNTKLIETRDQIILAGTESHICILQTALDLVDQGKKVYILEDAIVSRNILNKQNAIFRLRDAGCILTNVESIVFEWLGDSNNPNFKKIAPLIKDIC
jgi:nicotinamidase-related amidase